MKIVYCLNSVRHIGGIEMVTIVKANALAEVEGNEVYLVVTDNRNGVETTPLSSKVRLIDLDVNYYEDDWKSQLYVLKGLFIKRQLHKERLKEVLAKIQPDVVISVGLSEKYIVPSLRMRKSVIVREMHYVKNYRSLVAESFLGKIMAYCGDWYDYRHIIKKYDKIVVLTHEDKALNWNEGERVAVIPNPCTFRTDTVSQLTTKKVIAIGRLVKQKNFASLVRAFRLIANEHPDWVLEIYGEGGLRQELQDLIENMKLTNNVYLKGHTSEVQVQLINASCFMMSSIFEGFPLVLIEAMKCGLPVVSYACPCGPKDIISDGVDGFLVPFGDEKMLAERVCYLIENADIREAMGHSALKKAEKYSMDNIVSMWMGLFNDLLEAQRHRRKNSNEA